MLVPKPHWSYKAYSLFHTETGTTITMFDLSDTLLNTFSLKQFFKVNSSIDLFENIKIAEVLSFLQETGLYQKI